MIAKCHACHRQAEPCCAKCARMLCWIHAWVEVDPFVKIYVPGSNVGVMSREVCRECASLGGAS